MAPPPDAARWVRGLYAADVRVTNVILGGQKFLRHLFYFSFLGDRGFQILTDLYYDRKRFYATEEHNRRGFMPWEARVVEEYFPGRMRILVTSCGGGREVLAFAERGSDVVGTECHPDLCRIAQRLCRTVENAEVHCLPPDTLPKTDRPFDGCMVGWGGYSHLTPRSKRIALLKNLADHLRPGGPLVVSYLARGSGREGSISTALAIANGIRALTGRRRLEPGDTVSPAFHHRFLPGEAADEARRAGLEPLLEATAEAGLPTGDYPHLITRRPELRVSRAMGAGIPASRNGS